MFVELNNELTNVPNFPRFGVTELHPLQLSGWTEAVWETWRRATEAVPGTIPIAVSPTAPRAVVPGLGTTVAPPLAGPAQPPVVALTGAVAAALRSRDAVHGNVTLDLVAVTEKFLTQALAGPARKGNPPPPWRHLMYAYLIENTRVIEIFKKALHEALHDETFGTLRDSTYRWMRLTEDLFLREGTSSLVSSITSHVRPDLGATRRNAYHRMFGIDLNHGAEGGGAYPYAKANSSNLDFVKTLQDLLRELWRGYTSAGAGFSGVNTTDLANIDELVEKLKNMLNGRRLSADATYTNLAREELVAVSMASWFHLALADGSPVIEDLKVSGTTPEERLRKLGERVRLPAHGKARSFFFLAEDLPPLLRQIELGDLDLPAQQENLFKNAGTPRDAVLRIINHWSLATGVDLKSLPVAVSPR